VGLDEILYGGDDIEGDLDYILFSAVALNIQKWRTFKHLRWVQFLNQLVALDEILYGGDGIEYCLLYAYVGKGGILLLPRTCYFKGYVLLLYVSNSPSSSCLLLLLCSGMKNNCESLALQMQTMRNDHCMMSSVATHKPVTVFSARYTISFGWFICYK
jgi:hypothetical protein